MLWIDIECDYRNGIKKGHMIFTHMPLSFLILDSNINMIISLPYLFFE